MEDDIDAEFGASPLGKTRLTAAEHKPWSAAIPPDSGASLANAAPPLPPVSLPVNIDDMYSDLFGAQGEGETLLRTQVAQLRQTVSTQTQHITDLEALVEDLKKQNQDLSQTNETLLTNISVLYNTAKLEIQRKDDQIKELRQKERSAILGAQKQQQKPQGPSNANQQRHPQFGPGTSRNEQRQ